MKASLERQTFSYGADARTSVMVQTNFHRHYKLYQVKATPQGKFAENLDFLRVVAVAKRAAYGVVWPNRAFLPRSVEIRLRRARPER
jgi:hypothetical protein